MPSTTESGDHSTTAAKIPARRMRAYRRVRFWFIVFGVLGISAFAAGTALFPNGFAAVEEKPHSTYTIRRSSLTVSVTEQGTLESANNTEIKCKVRGFSTVTWVIPAGSYVSEGDELVRLDTKVIEEQHSLTKTNTFIAEATLEESKAAVAKAEIAIEAYEKGGYRSTLQGLEKELEARKRNYRTAQTMHERSEKLFRQGYVTELEVESNAFTVTRAKLELEVKEKEIEVLKDFTRKMEMATLDGNLTASKSKRAADEAGLAMEIKRRDRAKEELAACVITADKSGLVIYPSAAAWKRTPDITEGATVRKDQVLLLMPDLSQMQVKVGIHESVIDRVKAGQQVRVTLPDRDRTLEAEVSKVATVTRPAGWWTGNVVKYDTIIELPPGSGLKPGMSAEVEVVLAEYQDVLTVPVAAVVETDESDFCWVETNSGYERRILELGDSNDVFIVVNGGLKEGDKVVLNPAAFLEDAEQQSLATFDDEQPEADANSNNNGDQESTED